MAEEGNGVVESTLPLQEVLQNYVLEQVGDGFVIVSEPRTAKSLADPDLGEIGYTGATSWANYMQEDYNPELRGHLGLRKYDQMRRSDGQVRASLRLIKTPVLAARWYIEAASDDDQDREIATFVWDNLTKWMTVSWPQLLTEILLMLDFGHYVFEKVYGLREGKVIWQKFAPRHPLDISEWVSDAEGGPESIRMYDPDGGELEIPIDKLAVFTFDKEAGNMQGISILRSAYKHWYFKENLYKIDAIQKERHGIGIPIIKLPAGFSPGDRALADQMGRNLRTNEKAHVVLPPNWDILFAKIEGNLTDALKSAEHHDLQIAKNVLAPFLNDPGAVSQEQSQQMFLKGTRFIAEIIRDVFNRYCIPQLVDYNWDVDEYPELKVRRIGDAVDWRTISFAIRNFVGAGILVPDGQIEKWVREEMDLPAADPSTARIIIPPQQPGTIPDGPPDSRPGQGGPATDATKQNQGIGNVVGPPGLPRQSTAAGMRTGTGSQQGDRSGG